jgi:hypothetical protein
MCIIYIMLLMYAKIARRYRIAAKNGLKLIFCRNAHKMSLRTVLRPVLGFFWLWFNGGFALLSHKFDPMAQKKNTGAYWLLFFVSTVALIAAVASHFEYLTLILPFFATSFVKAMDIL